MNFLKIMVLLKNLIFTNQILNFKGKLTNSFNIESEPIKLCVNTITLSSLDTLNDIDSENEDALTSENTEENSATIDSSFVDTHINSYGTECFSNFNLYEKKTNKNDSLNKRGAAKSDSRLESVTNLTLSDQKMVLELMRKLKPYIQKCVRKELKNYLDTHLSKNSMTFTKYDGRILTKIGDF